MSVPIRFDQLDPAHQDAIRKNLDTMHAKGAPDADVESYLRDVEHLAPVGQEAPKEGLGTRVLHQVIGGVKQAVTHPIDTAAGVIEAPVKSFITAMSPGIGEARPDARLSKGGNSSGRAIDTSPYDAEHGGVTEKQRAIGTAQTLANIALPSIGRGTSSLVENAASRIAQRVGAGQTASKMLGTAAAGGTAGAVYSPDDPVAGGIAGALMAPVGVGAGKVAHKAMMGTGSAILDNVLGRPIESRPVVQAGPIRLGQIEGMADRAPQIIAKRAAMDADAGFQPPPGHRSLPPIALDQAGPNVEGLAEGIAQRPGPGRAQILKAVEARREQMRPALSQTLEENTGVPANARLKPLRDAVQARSDEAADLYGAARAATEGTPVESKTLDEISKTPIGKQALAWARAQKANRNSPLPEVERGGGDSPQLTELVGQGVPREKAIAALGDDAFATPTTEKVPDAETLHYAKQYVAKVARLGVHDGQGGKLATEAQGALTQWGKIRDELPEEFRAADDAFARQSRVIDAMNEGRNVYRTGDNPPGRPGKVLHGSLDGLAERAKQSTPEEAAARQVGAATATHAKLASAPPSIKSPRRIFPASDVATEQRGYAFPSPDKAADFEQAVAAWDRAQQQAERITGNSRTGLRGAEGSGMSSAAGASLLTSGPRAAIRTMIHAMGGSVRLANQQKLEGEIAKILTSPDGLNLPPAARAVHVHNRIQSVLQRGGLMAAVMGRQEQGASQ
jgi:hypothetical protein